MADGMSSLGAAKTTCPIPVACATVRQTAHGSQFAHKTAPVSRAPRPGTPAPDSHDHPQGSKVVTIPLAPRTARTIDLAIAERTGGPVFLAAGGRRLDRHGAGRTVRKRP